MLHSATTAAARRQAFRHGLQSGRLLRFPGAFNALCSLLAEREGFEGIYLSGAVISASLGLPDVGLTTLSEVASKAYEIGRVSALPSLVDADTGFGEPLSAARTVQVLEDMGASGCHLEDQVNPKRCGHLDGKEVVPAEDMVKRIRAAVRARRDPDFVICARTDARAVEGLDSALRRANQYVAAGADMVFMEALLGPSEWEQARKAIEVPILANMTEFGKSELLPAAVLASLGVNVVIYPVTLLRLAMGAAAEGLRAINVLGTQEPVIDRMQTRAELYDLIRYQQYDDFDRGLGKEGP